MIAELCGKLENHMEDELTGNVFGTLRYAAFEKILKPILKSCVRPKNLAAVIDKVHCEFFGDKIIFWQKTKLGEPDLLLTFDEVIICIEVKYSSGLSGDNQLEREAEIISRKAEGREKILLLLAKESACLDIVTDSYRKKIFDKFKVNLGYIAWEDFLDALKTLQTAATLNPYENIIVDDLIKLLTLKGFAPFRSFDIAAENIFADKYFEFGKEISMSDIDINIKNAAAVIRRTHENVGKFLTRCKNLAKSAGSNYELLTEKFLRWSSDVYPAAWMTNVFILLFKRNDSAVNTVYGIEVAILSACVVVIKYTYNETFDYSERISPADFYKYDEPLWKFENNTAGEYTFIKVSSDNKYNLNGVIFTEIPLSEITADNVEEKIFGNFEKLAML